MTHDRTALGSSPTAKMSTSCDGTAKPGFRCPNAAHQGLAAQRSTATTGLRQFKIGKTWGGLTAPRPVFFDFDRGVATARNPDFVKEYGLRWVFYETFEEKNLRKGIPFTANAFDDACRFFDAWMSPRGVWTSTTDGKKYEVGR